MKQEPHELERSGIFGPQKHRKKALEAAVAVCAYLERHGLLVYQARFVQRWWKAMRKYRKLEL